MKHLDTACTVWLDKFAPGWDGGDELPCVHPTLPVVDALQDCYSTDAHFVPYAIWVDGKRLPKIPRLTVASLKRLAEHNAQALFDVGVADVDCPEAHREKKEAPQAWRIQMRQLAEQTVPGCWHYDTRGGLRVVWAWPQSLTPEQHSERLGRAIEALRAAGLPADDLRDATRCFRLPAVVRDGEAQYPHVHMPEPGPAVWDPPNAPALVTEVQAASPVVEEVQSVWAGIESIRDPFKLPTVMEEGTRHNTLKRYAASLRAKNMERDQIEVALRDYEQTAGASLRPYQGTEEGERDLMGIIDWVCALPAGPSRTSPRARQATPKSASVSEDDLPPLPASAYDDPLETGDSVECAMWVLRHLESEGVQVVFDLGVVWRYRGAVGRFVELQTHALHRLIHTMSGMNVKGTVLKDGTQRFTKLKVSNSFACDVVMVLQQQRRQKGYFDACIGVAFSDCFVEVTPQGIVQHPHSADHRCNFGYDEPYTAQDPAAFLGFLHSVLASLPADELAIEVDNIAEWIGAMITRQTTVFQQALFIHGGGSNGKSQFVEVVEGLVPAERITHFPPQALGGDYNRAKLAKSMLNATTEVPSTEVSETASAVIKALISGDPMSARFPYESPFDFIPRGAVLLAANTLPAVRDHSHGMWRRIRCLNFDQEFSGANRVRNIGKLILEAEQVPIACWALRHLADLLARGEFRETRSSMESKENWRRASDDLEQWIHDELDVTSPPNGTAAAVLYTNFRLWAEASGVTVVLSKRQFFDRLKPKFRSYWGGPSTHRHLAYPLVVRKSDMH